MLRESLSSGPHGGPMVNPSVEPKARRESEEARRDSKGRQRRDSARRRSSSGKTNGDDVAAHAQTAARALGGTEATPGGSISAASSVAAEEARIQRRSKGLKRISVTDHLHDSLIHALEDVARDVGVAHKGTSGLEKLQDIMTEAKEKGIGVSKLFHFFLLSETNKKADATTWGPTSSNSATATSMPPLITARETEGGPSVDSPPHTSGDTAGGDGRLLRDTYSSKTKAEASRSTRSITKKPSTELMPSLQGKGKRPGTATSKRESGSSRSPSGTEHPESSHTENEADKGGEIWRSSLSRRSSSIEELTMRDRQINDGSFKHGLSTLGFKLSEAEVTEMYRKLDVNKDGVIDLMEFTRFCLEIPSMAWKAERARRGIVSGADRELDKAARDMANEALNNTASGLDSIAGGDGGLSAAAAAESKEPKVSLGRTVFRGEKFFWRTKYLIEVVVQLNAKEGFMAVSTFNTDTLEVYPIIFVDPSKIPVNDAIVADRVKELEGQHTAKHVAAAVAAAGVSGGGDEFEHWESANAKAAKEEARKIAVADKARMGYLAEYLTDRICMPDEKGALLQPDLLQPGVEVNPALPNGCRSGVNQEQDGQGEAAGGGTKAEPRPGLTRSVLDKWDTLLFLNPPKRVEGAPIFAKIKREESYFKLFEGKMDEFNDSKVKAQRLSNEAEAYSEEVSALMRKLAPLSYSASAPAAIQGEVALSQPGSGRIVLADDLSQGASRRRSVKSPRLLESQSSPMLLA